MRTLSVLLALAGVAVTLLLLAWFDVGDVWAAMASIGWGGLGLLLVLQAGLFVLLACAWSIVMPGAGLPLLVWGRMVRDAATTCLPFSPVGGYVIGARAITLQGLAWPTAAAGTVVDVTAEIAAQLLFALFGAAVTLLVLPGAGFLGPVAGGALVALALLVAGIWQRRRIGTLLRSLGARLVGEWFNAQGHGHAQRTGPGGIELLQTELSRLYDPGRLAAAALVHLSGWFATGLVTWISLRLLGASIDILHVVALEALLDALIAILHVVALEALLDALIAVAFVVPGAAGVQEAGYVGIGALFGVPPDLALGVSLLRRGKDLAWGVPILLAWQWREVRRLAA